MGFITNAAALLNMEVNGVKGLKDRLLRHVFTEPLHKQFCFGPFLSILPFPCGFLQVR